MIHLVQPCRGHITQRHGAKQSHNGLPHGGQDYAYYSGGLVTDEVFAAADGVVVYAGDARALGWPNQWYYNPDFDRTDTVDQSAGNVVTIRHNQNGVKFDTTYNHLAAWSVKAGQSVRAGQRIATIGDTGFSAGKHLHFELLFHPFNFGTPTYGRADPNPYFGSAAIAPQGTITPASEEEDMFTEEDRTMLRATLNKADGGQLRADLGYQNDTLFSKADGAWQNGILADIAARLGKTLDKADGGYIVGLLDALKPGSTDVDAIADAVVAALGDDVAAGVVEAIGRKLAGAK